MSELDDIEIYSKQDARDHLAFIRNPIEGLESVDVGRVLSEWLKEQDLNSQFLQMEVNDKLDDILSEEYEREDIGDYLVLNNIGIRVSSL